MDYQEKLKYTLFFLLGIVYSWLGAWVIGIAEWVMALSFGSQLSSLFFCDAPEPIKLIHSFTSMFPFALTIYGVSLTHIYEIPYDKLKRRLYLILGIIIIFLFDPDTELLFPSPISDCLAYIHKDLKFCIIGGPDIGEFSWSAPVSSIDYKVFDFYVLGFTILFSIPEKRNWRFWKKTKKKKVNTPNSKNKSWDEIQKDWQDLYDSLQD